MTETAHPTSPATRLTLSDIQVRYGPKLAVAGVNAEIVSGQALAIAGANGAGKTSLLGAIAGLVASEGQVLLDGQPLAPDIGVRLRAGVRLVPEHGKIYPTLTVAENLTVSSRRRGLVGTDDVHHWFPRLAERRRTLGGNLSGGEQQMLAIGMAILGTPRILLLDEPTLGLSVPVIRDLAEKLAALRRALDLALIVSESDVTWLPALTERAVVLDRGAVAAQFPAYTADTLKRIEGHMVGLAAA